VSERSERNPGKVRQKPTEPWKGDRNLLWQGGCGAFTVSHSNIDVVKTYIANQREHHQQLKMSFPDELRRLLQKHEVAFKEEYLL